MCYPCGVCGEEYNGVKEAACYCCQQLFHQNRERLGNPDPRNWENAPFFIGVQFAIHILMVPSVLIWFYITKDKIITTVRVESILEDFFAKMSSYISSLSVWKSYATNHHCLKLVVIKPQYRLCACPNIR